MSNSTEIIEQNISMSFPIIEIHYFDITIGIFCPTLSTVFARCKGDVTNGKKMQYAKWNVDITMTCSLEYFYCFSNWWINKIETD